MKLESVFSKLLACVVILTSIQSAATSASAQRRPANGNVSASQPKQNPRCSGGWSGVVTYKKTLKDSLESDEPGIRKSTDRIKHKTSRDCEYTGRAVVDGKDPQNAIVNTSVSFTDTDLQWGQEKVFDTCNSRENGHWFIIEGTDDRQTQAQASGSAKSFNLNVDELGGTYNFSLQFPDAAGVYKREQHVKRTGHCQPKNNEPYDKSENEPTKIEGGSFSVDSQKIDPNNPDTLSGTKIWGDDGTGEVRSFIYEVTWRFTRCPGKLLITELRFEHPKFPNFEDWKEIEETKGTIDGNRVKVKAKVLNMTAETKYADLKIVETYKGDKYNYARPDEPLPEAESSFRIEAGEEKEFEFIWDTEGQSWFDDSRPHLFHRIKAELAEGGQKKDEKEKPINIAPKPLILLHGIWSDYRVWEPLYQNLLTANHSYHWKAYAVGEKPNYGVMNMGRLGDPNASSSSVYDNADQVARYIKFAQEDSNAWHVDMVAHSTGGLVARLYLHKLMPNVPDARPQVKHLVMLGTPNGGVPCVDVFVGKFDLFKKELKAATELTNDEMLNFNRYVVNTGGTKLSALAGNPVPVVCGGLEWNDGFVTVKSATYNVSGTGQSNDLHHQLVDGKNFGNFVKPHLVTGPKRTYPLPVKNDPTDWRRWQVDNSAYGGSIGPGRATNLFVPGSDHFAEAAIFSGSGGPHTDVDPVEAFPIRLNDAFAKELKLAPKQTVDVDMPVEAASNLGVTFFANAGVNVSLVNERGVVIARSSSKSAFASTMFRSLFASKPVGAGVWKLKIENTSDLEQTFAGYGWTAEGIVASQLPR
jgi:pimeloyl-ACP methyl ester carboxylesterase